jgi:Uncharacterized protein conserved in bacteria (DUF2325)
MQKPPFKLATAASTAGGAPLLTGFHFDAGCCEPEAVPEAGAAPAATPTRARLADMDQHLHCSVIGTCISTAELRKLMARFLFVRDSSDLEVHHEAVSHASQGGPVAKALNKLLDQRHESVIQRFSKAHEPEALAALWEDALRQGEIPGAYWAMLTHRRVTSDLRQKAFGDVHMLSHLVGSANRADIRRLVALERENDELRERTERQQLRAQELFEERDQTIARLQNELAQAQSERSAERASAGAGIAGRSDANELAAAMSAIALQTARRERAEQAAGVATEEASRTKEELAHLIRHVNTLNRELAAAETQLHEIGDSVHGANRLLDRHLRGQRVFYVGGRPSSTPAIRDLVLRHGGEFQHHDGGLEDRKGLLASGVAWAQLVVFPVDCIDHDSAGNLKRMCLRQGVPFVPLRGASVASFAAALANPAHADGAEDEPRRSGPPGCLKHG